MKYTGQWKLEIEGKEELKFILNRILLMSPPQYRLMPPPKHQIYIYNQAKELYKLLFEEEK